MDGQELEELNLDLSKGGVGLKFLIVIFIKNWCKVDLLNPLSFSFPLFCLVDGQWDGVWELVAHYNSIHIPLRYVVMTSLNMLACELNIMWIFL